MNWAVGITTAPRPTPLLEKTAASLGRAGFDGIEVFNDVPSKGAWRNWLRAVRVLLEKGADAVLVCQDDAVFCRGLRGYLDRTLWPGESVAVCSPYCPAPYRRKEVGWHARRAGWYLVGAVCWAIPRDAAAAILRDLGQVQASHRVDARVGRWAAQTKRSVWHHTPSLVQHTGLGNSALGDGLVNDLRRAADFPGEGIDLSEMDFSRKVVS